MAPEPPNPPGTTSNLTPESPEITAFATRMYDAARAGDVATFTAALPAGLPPNLTNASTGDTLLMLASYHGHLPLTRLLLQHGADANRLNDRQQSPLSGAIFKNEEAIVECLLQEGGADVDVGQPSAWECMRIFGKEERWRGSFEGQRERLRGKRDGGEGLRNGDGGGGGVGKGREV